MTDLPSSLGIEAVECVAEGGPNVTVRVTGRWRRRRPEPRGQATLVVETDTGRRRFPAMPEPPSLTGAAPGTWRMSFSVPAVLAPGLPGRTFLQLGGVMVPLPIGEVEIAADAPGPEVLEERRAGGSEVLEERRAGGSEVLEERRAGGSEPAADSAQRQAAGLAAHVERLERELGDARGQSERLCEAIGERDRRLRAAQQEVHAERALRADLEQQLTRQRRGARHDLNALHDRVAELERELIRMRRAVDEAQHLAAAEAARAAAARRLAGPAPAGDAARAPDPLRAGLSLRELELHRSARGARPAGGLPRPVERAADQAALRLEAGMVSRRAERAKASGAGRDTARVAALERELAVAREEIEVQRQRSARAYEAIELVRAELCQLRPAARCRPRLGCPPGLRSPAASRPLARASRPLARPSRPLVWPSRPLVWPSRPARAGRAEPLVRADRADRPSRPPEPAEPTEPAEPVQAERLSEALARLRERTPPPAGEDAVEPAGESPPAPSATARAQPLASGRPVRPWLAKPFRALTAQDASAAGRLLLALLPAQRAADPQPVAYDLVLSDVLVAHVTVDSLAVHVEHGATARPPAEIDFQLVGDLASVARLLRAGRVRRRLRVPPRRMARIRGDRRRLAALDRLIEARLTAGELRGAGVKLDPLLALTLAALTVEPEWTAGERFTIAHREPAAPSPGAYLHVRDGRPSLASAEPPHGPVSTVVICAADELILALAGSAGAEGIEGDRRPLSLLAQWLERAECG